MSEQDDREATPGLDIEVPDYVRNGIVLVRTADGTMYMITQAAQEWLMTGDNCASRYLNAMLRKQVGK
jgi:hypothetical protein